MVWPTLGSRTVKEQNILQYSVTYCDKLGRCFRFVCVYACTAVFLCCCRFSANKDLHNNPGIETNPRYVT